MVILAMPNLLTGTFGFERAQTFEMQSAAIIMQMVGCILAGYFADRFGCGKVMMVGALAVALTAAVFTTVWVMPHIQLFLVYICCWVYALVLSAWCRAVWLKCSPRLCVSRVFHFLIICLMRLLAV